MIDTATGAPTGESPGLGADGQDFRDLGPDPEGPGGFVGSDVRMSGVEREGPDHRRRRAGARLLDSAQPLGSHVDAAIAGPDIAHRHPQQLPGARVSVR